MQAVNPASSRAIQSNVDTGDEIHVVLKSGAAYDLVVNQITPAYVVGKDHDGKSWKIASDQIQALSVKKTSGVKTVGLVAVIGILAAVGLAVLGAYSLTHSN